MRTVQALLGFLILLTVVLLSYLIWFQPIPEIILEPEVVINDVVLPKLTSRVLETSQIDNALLNLKSSVYEQISITNTAVGLTAANVTHTTYGSAYAVRISVEGDGRITMDGSTPTYTLGEMVHDSEVNNVLMVYWPDNVANVMMINDAVDVAAVFNVTYFYQR